MPEDTRPAQPPTEEVREEAAGKEDGEPEAEVTDEYFKKYVLSAKGKDPEEKINEACKEINYRNLLVLIAVGDYIGNKAKNIQTVAKKWGLSFSAMQWAMLQKKEHSMGGRQYGKRKKSTASEEKEEPTQKSKCLEKKSSTTMSKEVESEQESTMEAEPEKELMEVSLGEELPDIPWTKSK